MSSAADLASASSTLDGLIGRISSAVDSFTGTDNEDLSLGLIEVERALTTANRRLERLVKELRERG